MAGILYIALWQPHSHHHCVFLSIPPLTHRPHANPPTQMADTTTIIAPSTTAATSLPPPPPNHGRKWTREEDEQIAGAPQTADADFAHTLGRSEHAVQSRRAVLAARMHLAGGRSVRECAEQMGADVARTMAATATVGKEGAQGKESRGGGENNARQPKRAGGQKVDLLSNLNRQRTPPYPTAPSAGRGGGGNHNGMFQRRPSAVAPPHQAGGGGVQHSSSSIGTICGLIKQSGGETAWLWEQDAFAPTLVQYYAGFQAYAAYLRERK